MVFFRRGIRRILEVGYVTEFSVFVVTFRDVKYFWVIFFILVRGLGLVVFLGFFAVFFINVFGFLFNYCFY